MAAAKEGLNFARHPYLKSGALCAWTQSLILLSRLHLDELKPSSTGAFRYLAKQNVFPKKIHAVCDATLYETTNKYKGCGCVTHKRKVKARGYRKNGELKKVKVTLYGWKIWAIYEIKTGVPLAIKIDTIEKPDNLHIR
ncbi:MAG: hypothetical protein U9P49_09890 [Thermodesulfobacteriota bacterium]|nr:hypothetical protein [Thermodesulfobacteriota bacterium]